MFKSSKLPRTVLLMAVICLASAICVAVLDAFLRIPQAQQIVATLGDAFKLCLGALLTLLSGDALRRQR